MIKTLLLSVLMLTTAAHAGGKLHYPPTAPKMNNTVIVVGKQGLSYILVTGDSTILLQTKGGKHEPGDKMDTHCGYHSDVRRGYPGGTTAGYQCHPGRRGLRTVRHNLDGFLARVVEGI